MLVKQVFGAVMFKRKGKKVMIYSAYYEIYRKNKTSTHVNDIHKYWIVYKSAGQPVSFRCHF